jgi:hypothetical protein
MFVGSSKSLLAALNKVGKTLRFVGHYPGLFVGAFYPWRDAGLLLL